MTQEALGLKYGLPAKVTEESFRRVKKQLGKGSTTYDLPEECLVEAAKGVLRQNIADVKDIVSWMEACLNRLEKGFTGFKAKGAAAS